MLAAAGAAVGFGLSYPMTAVALRAWSPLGAAAVQGTCALVLIATPSDPATGSHGSTAAMDTPRATPGR